MSSTGLEEDLQSWPEPYDRKLGKDEPSTLGLKISSYLRARKQFAVDRRMYSPPDDIPANKQAIIGHLNTQIRLLQASAKKYAALREVIKEIPDSDDSQEWQLLRNTVVHGTLDEPIDPIRGPEGIWLADE